MKQTRTCHHRRRAAAVALVAVIVLAGCAGSGTDVSGDSLSPTMDLSEPIIATSGGTCAGGRLTVDALQEMQGAWEAGVAVAQERASAWQEDARLIEAQIECAFLGPGVDVKGRFYSGKARAFFASYTGVTTPIDPGVPEPPRLDTAAVSFERLADTLLSVGVEPSAEIHPTSGINIRYNGTTTPFGPPDSPPETVIVHVIVVTDGDTRDIFIDTREWEVISF